MVSHHCDQSAWEHGRTPQVDRSQAESNHPPADLSSANQNRSPSHLLWRRESPLEPQCLCTRSPTPGFQVGSSTGTSLSSLPWHHPAPVVFHQSTLSSHCRKSRRAFFANLKSTQCNKILIHTDVPAIIYQRTRLAINAHRSGELLDKYWVTCKFQLFLRRAFTKL